MIFRIVGVLWAKITVRNSYKSSKRPHEKIMKPKSTLHSLLLAAGCYLLAIPSASAATGTWNVDSNGLWSGAGNWTPGIADGASFAANFTNNITADRTVSLDSDRALTTVVFGDSDISTAGSWILDNNAVAANNLILSGTTPTFTVNALGSGKEATISAIIQGTTGFTKDGAGTLVLSGNNTPLTGNLSLNGGTLSVAASNSLGSVNGSGGAWILMNGGTLRATGSFIMNASNSATDGNYVRRVSISGNSTIEVTGSNNLGVGSTGVTGTSPLYGSGTLNKTGSGTLTLRTKATIANSFSGNTNVNAGTLNLQTQGALSNSATITVASGANLNVASVSGGWTLGAAQTLAGSGTITGAAIIAGTLRPGTSPGTLTFQNTLAMATTTTTIMEIDGNSGAGVAGGHDFINLTGAGAAGALTYGGTMTLDMGVLFGIGSYTWNLFDMDSETETFTSITLTDQYSGSLLDTDLNGIWDLNSGINTWQFNESTGIIGLTVAAIPEPSVALLGSLSLLFLLRRRRLEIPSQGSEQH